MPNNRKDAGRGAKRSSTSLNGHRFIEYDLTANDKEVLRSEYSESDFSYDLIEDLVQQGYKFSLSYSEASSCYIATITDRRQDSQFNNTSLSGRGATIAHARIACLYRHFVVAQEDWNVFGSGSVPRLEDYG